ncbi:MAG: hypothetical protein Q9187_006134 [Circinaria calcarea]
MRAGIALLVGITLTVTVSTPLPHQSTPSDTTRCIGRPGRWTNLAPIAGGIRQEHSTVTLGDKIYIMGGIFLEQSATNETITQTIDKVEVYSISQDSWGTVAPLPIAMNHANAAVVDGKIYVLGGLAGGEVWTAFPDCYVYDPKTDHWETLPPMPKEQARGSSAVGVRGTRVYLTAGMRSLDGSPGGLHDTVDTVTSYDTKSGVWKTLPSLPAPRDHAGAALVGHRMYVLGGRNHGQINVRNTTYVLDIRSSEAGWTQKADMPTARGGLSAGVVGSVVYTFGGEGNPTPGSNGVFNQTEAYVTVTDTWTKLAPMALPRHGTSAASAGGGIYIPGGSIAEGAGPVDAFDVFRPC